MMLRYLVLVVLVLGCSEDARTQAVTRISDLEITNQAQWTNTTGPTITSGAGDPNGVITQPIGSLRFDTTTPAIWQNQDGATTWTQLGSGAANPANIWDLPDVADPRDDEFLDATLNPAWSVQSGVVVGSAIDPYASPAAGNVLVSINTRRRSWLIGQPNAVYRIEKTASLNTNDFIWIRFEVNNRWNSVTNNDAEVSLGLSACPFSTTNFITAQWTTDAGDSYARFAEVEASVFTQVGRSRNEFSAQMFGLSLEGLGIQKLGTTYHGWGFTSAGHAIWLGSLTFAAAVDCVSITFANATTAAPGSVIHGVDFIRFNASATFLP